MRQKEAVQLSLLFHKPYKCIFSLLFRLLITYNAHCRTIKTIWRKVWQLQVYQEIPALDSQKQSLALQGHLPFLWHADLLLIVLGLRNQ